MAMGFVRVLGNDLHYTERGSGPPLLFLHGSGSCGEAWDFQFEAFAGRFRVIAYDSVNHGHSSNSPAGQPEPDRADELEGFLAALGLEHPVIAGNSMGAMSLLRWAVRHPDQARALIPSGMGVQPPDAPARPLPAADPIGDELIFLGAERGFTPDFPAAQPELYDRYIRLRSTATRIEASRHPRTPAAANPGRDELADLVAGISSPMQIVVGEHDWLHDAGVHLHELVKGSRLAEIAGAPHNVYYQAAAQYNEVVTAFLAEIPAAS
jgi:pimeloyl-ACP methyl ester carboxylesterase